MLWTWVNDTAHFTCLNLQRGALRHSNPSWDFSWDLGILEINQDKEQTSARSKVWASLLGFQRLTCSLKQIGLLLKEKLPLAQCGVCPVGFEIPDIRLGRGTKSTRVNCLLREWELSFAPQGLLQCLIHSDVQKTFAEWVSEMMNKDWLKCQKIS